MEETEGTGPRVKEDAWEWGLWREHMKGAQEERGGGQGGGEG